MWTSPQPVDVPNEATLHERDALYHFWKMKTGNVPHLLAAVQDVLEPGVDEQAMVGGYVVFILMTKVPGKPIVDEYWDVSRRARRDSRSV